MGDCAEEQEEELQVLESIFGDDLQVLNYGGQGGSSSPVPSSIELQVLCRVTLPEESAAYAELFVSADTTTEAGQRPVQKIMFGELPPVIMRCTLPQNYPAEEMPRCLLSCDWLSHSQLEAGAKALVEMFSGQIGLPVIFAWVDWIRNDFLTHVGLYNATDDALCLKLYPVVAPRVATDENGSDEGASDLEDGIVVSDGMRVAGYASLDDAVQTLMDYNKAKNMVKYLEDEHMCLICLAEKPGREFTRIPCGHQYCKDCMKDYCTVMIDDGSVQQIRCPNTECKQLLPPQRDLVSSEQLQKWERLLLQKTLDAMGDVSSCPRCQNYVVDDDGETARCSQCFYVYCTQCNNQYHPGQPCESSADVVQKMREKGVGNLSERERKQFSEAQQVMQLAKDGAKRCPGCRMFVAKDGGCNKMVCPTCNKAFCWLCLRGGITYDHFQTSSCILFAVPWDVRQEAAPAVPMDQRGIINQQMQLQLAMMDMNLKPVRCANCRQENYKTGNNNHIKCWACSKSFCYLCKQLVPKPGRHYGVGKCANHSED